MSKPPCTLWTTDEQLSLRDKFNAGLSDLQIIEAFAKQGVIRSHHSIQKMRGKLGLKRARILPGQPKQEDRVAETEDDFRAIISSNQRMDAKFRAAMLASPEWRARCNQSCGPTNESKSLKPAGE